MRTPRRDELDMVPFLNLVTLLIPVLLLTADLSPTKAVVPTTLPAICGGCMADCGGDAPPLNLTVAITDDGLWVRGESQVLGEDGVEIDCTVQGCPRGTWDTAALGALLDDVSREHPDSQDAILVPASEVTTDTLVAVMDAVRGPDAHPRFPFVVLAGGVD